MTADVDVSRVLGQYLRFDLAGAWQGRRARGEADRTRFAIVLRFGLVAGRNLR